MTDDEASLGHLLREARVLRGLTASELAGETGLDPAVIHTLEAGGGQAEDLRRLASALRRRTGSRSGAGPSLRIRGETKLSGRSDVKPSKNGSVALLCASLLNRGTTTIANIARIEEVDRLLEVLGSIGVEIGWDDTGRDVTLSRPRRVNIATIDADAARRTRSAILLFGPLLHLESTFDLPFAGGCLLGTRTIEPHMIALRRFGLAVEATDGLYRASRISDESGEKTIVLLERGDTVTENAVMAAAASDNVTIIKNASSNYMVQDLCFLLRRFGVGISGIGTTTLTVKGVSDVDVNVSYTPAEDPVEAMTLLTAGILTRSELTVGRVPIEFLEVELAILEEMGLSYRRGPGYYSANGSTLLVDVTVMPSELKSPVDKVHPMPFPGLNIDNLPFFAAIAASATGATMVHDWVYDNRAIYLTELNKLGASVRLLDPHRLYIEGPTDWSATEMVSPPALRPAVVILLAMLAARGTSVLRNTYVINRGYEGLADRLNALGAQIETFYGI